MIKDSCKYLGIIWNHDTSADLQCYIFVLFQQRISAKKLLAQRWYNLIYLIRKGVCNKITGRYKYEHQRFF